MGWNRSIFSFVLFAVLAFSQTAFTQTARLQVIHNAADPAAASVDVYLNDGLLLDDFAFRTATSFIDAPAGAPISIAVAGGNSNSSADALATFDLTLTPGETYVAIANGVLDPNGFAANPDGRETGFTLLLQANGQEAASDTSGVEFFAVHGATDAPTVDVIARGVTTLVDDAAYGDVTGYLNVPPASYILDVTPGGDNNTIVASFEADLSGLAGGAATVVASGFLTPDDDQNGAAFGLFAALPTGGDLVEFPARSVTSVGENGLLSIPETFSLSQNYPNPFNPTTSIQFTLGQDSKVSLKVYDLLGREAATLLNERRNAGSYEVTFEASNLPTGTYFYRLESGSSVQIRKMTLLK